MADDNITKPQGPFGDVLPQAESSNPDVNRTLPQEKVQDRDNVSTVTPGDYPLEQRQAGNESGMQGNPPSYGDGAASEESNDPQDFDDEGLDDEE